MQFELDDDRALLRASAREFLEKESALADARSVMEESPEGYSKALYAQLGELGYAGLLLDEEEGGMGALAFALVLAEMGRVAFPGPFLDLALSVRVLAGCGEAGAAWAERATRGEALVLLARSEDIASGDPGPVETRFESGRVRGTKRWVAFGAQADALLVETREGIALVERPGAGWSSTPLPTLDHSQRYVEIALDEPGSLVAEGVPARALLADAERLAALGAAATLLGLAERSLEMAVQYTLEREAFGAPIATFQALQHRAADMLLKVESTRSAVLRAAWAEENEPETADYLVAVAKAFAGPAARDVCAENIQMHGGVGFTWEYDPHVYFKRVKTLEQFHGATASQLRRALERRP